MIVKITDIDQRYSLTQQSLSNYLVIELPSGKKFQAEVDDTTVAAVLAASKSQDELPPLQASQSQNEYDSEQRAETYTNGHSSINPFELAEADPEPSYTPVDDESEEQIEHHVETGVVEWEKLPDTQLPPSIKAILRASGINPVLSITDLNTLKLEITTKMASRPKVGSVEWDTGPRRKITSVPRRTVQMDEAGNPMPPGGILEMGPEKDPGEVRGDDDDGIQQA